MADYTFVGGGGIIYRAPAGTQLPEGTSGKLPTESQITTAGFVEVGEISSDGLRFTPSKESTDIPNWGGSTLRSISSSHTEEFAFSMANFVQTITQKAAFGDDAVSTTAATTSHGTITKLEFTDKMDTEAAWLFYMEDGDKMVIAHAARAVVTGWDEVSFISSDISKWGMTCKALKDETSGCSVTVLSDDGVVSA